jgi:ankyrin repeat protein
MDAIELPARANLEHYKKLAKDFLKACKTGDSASLKRIQKHYERQVTVEMLRQSAQRAILKLKGSRAKDSTLTLSDAQYLVAQSCGFESWPKFKKHLDALARRNSPVSKFEMAADAVVNGDAATLEQLLRENPELIHARSTREHGATLLHYVSANGVEDFRQKTPKNAVQILKILLRAGADVEAIATSYGGSKTLDLVATSFHPAKAGVQIALMETLLAAGAAVEGFPGKSVVNGCLANGRRDAAEFLAARGATLDLEGAARVGRLDIVKSFFDESGRLKSNATAEQMKAGFMWACEYGRESVVEFLLHRGIEIGAKSGPHGQTGLHWAAHAGHANTVKLLLEWKAPSEARDESFAGTPLDWALHGWGNPPTDAKPENYYDVVALLVAAGAKVDEAWLADPHQEMPLVQKVRADSRMMAALRGEKSKPRKE